MPSQKENAVNQDLVRETVKKLVGDKTPHEVSEATAMPFLLPGEVVKGMIDGTIPFTPQAVMILCTMAFHANVSDVNNPTVAIDSQSADLIAVLHDEIRKDKSFNPKNMVAMFTTQPMFDKNKLN